MWRAISRPGPHAHTGSGNTVDATSTANSVTRRNGVQRRSGELRRTSPLLRSPPLFSVTLLAVPGNEVYFRQVSGGGRCCRFEKPWRGRGKPPPPTPPRAPRGRGELQLRAAPGWPVLFATRETAGRARKTGPVRGQASGRDDFRGLARSSPPPPGSLGEGVGGRGPAAAERISVIAHWLHADRRHHHASAPSLTARIPRPAHSS